MCRVLSRLLRCAGMGASVVAADVLWSDPILAPGLDLNDSRGIGLKVPFLPRPLPDQLTAITHFVCTHCSPPTWMTGLSQAGGCRSQYAGRLRVSITPDDCC